MNVREQTPRSLACLVLGCILSTAAIGATPAAPYNSPAIIPDAPIALFNGKDLAGFYTWMPQCGYADPDHVFTVVDQVDGAPAIRISGQHDGGLVTRANYANYRLVAEFRFGVITWGARIRNARDSGILLHGQGMDGAYQADFRSAWFRSIEFQIIEGGVGDLLLLGGCVPGVKERIPTTLTLPVTPGTRVWNADGTPTEFNTGRIDWPGRNPKWTNTIGYRGPRDAEHPAGEWNHVEAVCRGGDVEFFVNGVKVNGGRNGNLREGRILIQSEGAEIYFRRLDLYPLAQ